MSNEQKQKALVALRKANSSLGRVIEMAAGSSYCVDIMQQNLAVIGLLKSAHHLFMAGHLNCCFKDAMAAGNEKKKAEMVEEILKVSRLANK